MAAWLILACYCQQAVRAHVRSDHAPLTSLVAAASIAPSNTIAYVALNLLLISGCQAFFALFPVADGYGASDDALAAFARSSIATLLTVHGEVCRR